MTDRNPQGLRHRRWAPSSQGDRKDGRGPEVSVTQAQGLVAHFEPGYSFFQFSQFTFTQLLRSLRADRCRDKEDAAYNHTPSHGSPSLSREGSSLKRLLTPRSGTELLDDSLERCDDLGVLDLGLSKA